MKKVFILDDDPMRYPMLIEYAQSLVEDAQIVTALDSESAKKLLAKEKEEWELLLLDHDLGFHIGDGRHNTGYEVAKFISNNGVKFKKCILHTVNFMGAQRMWHELKGIGEIKYKPFTVIYYERTGKRFYSDIGWTI